MDRFKAVRLDLDVSAARAEIWRWLREVAAQLKHSTVADTLPHLTQEAVAADISLSEFLESVLKTEVSARQPWQRTTISKLASFPAFKSLDSFDFSAATRTHFING
nr:ATP-binding protein [Noviherbaspirillum malthae]